MDRKIVEVTWVDAWTDMVEHLTIKAAQDAKPMVRTSVGYLLKDAADCIVLTFGLIGDAECDALHTIPKAMITKIRGLK